MKRLRVLLLITLLALATTGLSQNPGSMAISGSIKVAKFRTNADAVIYIDKIPGKTFPPPHESIKLDQINLRFVPHVLPVLIGSTVAFPNSDEIRHNVFSPTPNQKFNLGTYDVGKTRVRVFDKPGEVDLLCNVHVEMSAYIIVTETPYFAVSDAAGNYAIKNVPPGHYVLKAWHEGLKSQVREIDVTANQDLKGVNFDFIN